MSVAEEMERRLGRIERRLDALDGQAVAAGIAQEEYIAKYREAMKRIEERREMEADRAMKARAAAGKTDEMDAEDVEDAGREWMRH